MEKRQHVQSTWSKSFVKGEEPGKKNIIIFLIQIVGGSQWNAPFVLSLVMHPYAFVRSNNPWYAMGKQNMQSEKVCFLGSIFWRNFNFS